MTTNVAAKQMLAADLKNHPEYPYVNWKLEPDESGKVSVGQDRGGPFNIYYEVHGHGPIHLVWIMGLGSIVSMWQRQTKDFGHTNSNKYSCLVFDNRGMGRSDKPLMRYSTSEMAADLIEVLDHIGWTKKRQLHVIGVSMGGMISQEMGLLIPERIASMSLLSTASGLFNTVGFFENLRNRINLFIPKSVDTQIANVKGNVYTEEWLAAPDELEYTVESFPTNGDRFGAYEVAKRSNPENFTRVGFMAQAVACGWHYKSPEQLKELADRIGRNRIQLFHGTKDKFITIPHAHVLLEGLGGEYSGITTHFIEGQAHAIPVELREEFNRRLEELVEKAEDLNQSEN